MSNCLNCGKELHHVEGRRPKKYCDNNCKQTYWQKKKPKEEKTKVLSMKEWDEIQEKLKNAGVPPIKKENLKEFAPKEETQEVDNLEIKKQIEAIKAEKMPSYITMPIAKKSWLLEREKRISDLISQLNK